MSVKKVVLIVAGVLVLALVLKICGREEPAVEVQIERVARRDLRSVVTGTGQVKPKVSVDISSDVMGRVLEVPVREGDPVKRGQMLARLDSSQLAARMTGLRAAAESSRANLEQARANLARLQKTFERQANMHKQKLVSESDWETTQQARDNAVAAEKVARATLEQASAALEEAQNTLEKYTISAPMDGIVTRKNIEPGEMAVAGTLSVPGTLLLTVSDLSVMEVEVEVDEIDVVHVRAGQAATVLVDAFPERSWPGEVTEVGTSAIEQLGISTVEQAKQFRVVITLGQPDGGPNARVPLLKPGLSASADIVTATREHSVAIPIQALTVRPASELLDATPPPPAPAEEGAPTPAPTVRPQEDAETPELEGIFLVEDGVARFRPVRLGIVGEQHFEVLVGLAGGESIVVGPYETLRELKDGQPVREKQREVRGKGRGAD